MTGSIETYNTGKTYLEYEEVEVGIRVIIEKVDKNGSTSMPQEGDWKAIARDLAEAIYEMRQTPKGIMSIGELLDYEPPFFVHKVTP